MIDLNNCLSGLVLCAALISTSHAQESEHWIADANGCLAANPAPSGDERIEWSGACADGYIAGEGTLTWYEGTRAVARDSGNFERGALSGHGRIESFDGWSYEGEFPGRGVMRLQNGAEVPAQTKRENNGWHIEQVAERGL